MRNINYNINSLWRLCVGMHIIYISIYISIGRALHTGSRNENNIGLKIGRLPLKIESNFSRFTADQWQNWCLIYSPIRCHTTSTWVHSDSDREVGVKRVIVEDKGNHQVCRGNGARCTVRRGGGYGLRPYDHG